MHISKGLLSLTGLFLLFGSLGCDNSDAPYEIGEGFVNTNSRVVFIDTLSLHTATVLLDSVPTSGSQHLLVGRRVDEDMGVIESKAYFELGLASNLLDRETAYQYDSLVLVLNYSGYYNGDTTALQEMEVHLLTEEIELDDFGHLYNVSEVPYESIPLGTRSFRARPRKGGELTVRLSDELGMELLSKLSDQEEEVRNLADFQHYFKGICLTASTSVEGAIIGFNGNLTSTIIDDATDEVSDVQVAMRLHYRKVQQEPVEEVYEFPLINSPHQFNQIHSERGYTKLAPLTEQETELSANETDQYTYLQGGIGLCTRIEFPNLENLYDLGGGAILQAELVFEPLSRSYGSGNPALIDSLVLYETDRKNQVGNMVLNDNGDGVSYAYLTIDNAYHENTSYRFSLTRYFDQELGIDEFSEQALLMFLPNNYMQSSVERLLIGGHLHRENAMRLEVYYTVSE